MKGSDCIRAVLLDLFSLFLVYLPWIILQQVEPFHRGFYCDDESLKYPYKPSTIPGAVATALGIIIPILVILSFEVFFVCRQSKLGISPRLYTFGKFNFHAAWLICYKVIGIFLFGAAAQQTITNICKYTIGRLRPHFFDVCQPDYSTFNCTDARGYHVYVTEYVCNTTDESRLKDARLSFASGHSSVTSYCAVFLVLYLQYRMTCQRSVMARPFCQLIAIWLSLGTCVSRIMDYKHHWSDVLGGLVIGVTVALLTGRYIAQFFRNSELRMFEEQVNTLIGQCTDTGNMPYKNGQSQPNNQVSYTVENEENVSVEPVDPSAL